MKHRIFIAINLPEDIKKELQSYQENIEEKFASIVDEDKSSSRPFANARVGEGISEADIIRWTKKDGLHITLIFLGYLSNEELAETCQTLKEVAQKYQPFTISLKKVAYGPPKKMPPRMVWVLGEKSKTAKLLKEDLEKSLLDSGVHFSLEEREFTPHITLGRIKTWLWRRIEPEEQPEISKDITLGFEVNSIEVMESCLKRGGAEYTILDSALLAE